MSYVWLAAVHDRPVTTLPQRTPAAPAPALHELETTTFPAVQHAVPPSVAQHMLGPAPLFDPDRVAPVDPDPAPPLLEEAPAAVLELEPIAGSAWFEPATPAAPMPTSAAFLAPPAAVLLAAADVLHGAGHRDAGAWVDAWAGR